MREIKFRGLTLHEVSTDAEWKYGWLSKVGSYYVIHNGKGGNYYVREDTVGQFTGLLDKNGKEIYFGDILEFADKWEWYRGSYGIKMRFAEPERLKELREKYDKEPMERREVIFPDSYEWLLSSEVQRYWQVIGNIHQHPELLTP